MSPSGINILAEALHQPLSYLQEGQLLTHIRKLCDYVNRFAGFLPVHFPVLRSGK